MDIEQMDAERQQHQREIDEERQQAHGERLARNIVICLALYFIAWMFFQS